MMTIRFTTEAWRKQCSLVQYFNTEIAWHGLVRPIKEGYEIYDILVYPQEVTGGTVETDQQKYQMWLMQQPDEIFQHIRYQGHSHVNMTPHPSGVDLDNQRRMQIPDNDFYIFLIWNKASYYTARVYDHGKLLDENQVEVMTESVIDNDFINQVKPMITVKPAIHYPMYAVRSYSDNGWEDVNWYERWQKRQKEREAAKKRRRQKGRLKNEPK